MARHFPALTLEKTEDDGADIVRHTAQLNETLETMIRRAPEPYLWQHIRWQI